MRLLISGALLGVLAAAPLSADDRIPEFFSGRAVTRAGVLWYTEEHRMKKNGERVQIETTYLAADGKLIAELWTEPGSARYLPRTRFVDHRDKYRYGIEPIAADRRPDAATSRIRRLRGSRWRTPAASAASRRPAVRQTSSSTGAG